MSDIDLDEEKDSKFGLELSEHVDLGTQEGGSSSRSGSEPIAPEQILSQPLPIIPLGTHAKSPQQNSSWLSGLMGAGTSHGSDAGRVTRGTESAGIGGGSRRQSHNTFEADGVPPVHDDEIAFR